VEVTQAQYHCPVPLIGHLNRGRNYNGQKKSSDSNHARLKVAGDSVSGVGQCRADAQNYNEYQ
jgi:hypothetical protein